MWMLPMCVCVPVFLPTSEYLSVCVWGGGTEAKVCEVSLTSQTWGEEVRKGMDCVVQRNNTLNVSQGNQGNIQGQGK